MLLVATILVDCSPAIAHAVGDCGPNAGLGDYRVSTSGRVWCSYPGGGVLALLPYLFAAIGSAYDVVTSINSLIVIGIGLAAGWYGGRLTGSPARIHGTVMGGTFNGTISPAVQGTASSFLGRLTGALLSLVGLILIVMGVISLVNGG
ncbi:MAG TPA: hypothetical protein PK177_19570 [Burkholderiaceae bacterium]|nr:hypothetical protein [Burkholderiaceae bacterium]